MFSRRGWLALATAVLLYLGATVWHYPELGVLAAASLLALLVGFAWVVYRPHLRISRVIEPSRVTRGDIALARLSVANQGRLAVSATVGEERCGSQIVPVNIPRLKPGASEITTYRLPSEARGIYDVGPLTVVRQDPFGLWRRSQRLGSMERLYVYPQVHAVRALPVGRTRSLDGREFDVMPQGSITFHALREYVPGDDLRHIHWRSYAHSGTLMVKEHVDTSLPQITVVLDTSLQSYSAEEFEQAVEVAASLVTATVDAGLPIRLVTTHGEGAQGRGLASDTQVMFGLLAGVTRSGEGTLRSLVNSLVTDRRGDVLLAVIGNPSQDELIAIGALGGRYNRGAIIAVSENAAELDIAVPRHLTAVRVQRAEAFPPLWEELVGR
jgi:uncharacterized protein (DUF58 family)